LFYHNRVAVHLTFNLLDDMPESHQLPPICQLSVKLQLLETSLFKPELQAMTRAEQETIVDKNKMHCYNLLPRPPPI
jgi:hypothetical protein